MEKSSACFGAAFLLRIPAFLVKCLVCSRILELGDQKVYPRLSIAVVIVPFITKGGMRLRGSPSSFKDKRILKVGHGSTGCGFDLVSNVRQG